MKEFTLPSGALLQVEPADFPDSFDLFKGLCAAAKGLQMPESVLKAQLGSTLQDTIKQNTAVFSLLLEKFADIVNSPAVKDAVFRCGKKAIYNRTAPVSMALFDDPEHRDAARGDFLMICFHITEVNCQPFLAPIFSRLRALPKTPDASPQSK